MFLRELDAAVTHVRGVGPALARQLAGVGVVSVGSLLSYFPRDWEDRGRNTPLAAWASGRPVRTDALVLAHDWFGVGRMRTLKVHIEDDSARAVLVCFNRPFLEGQLPAGSRIRLFGRFFFKYGEIQSAAFEFERIPEYGDGTAVDAAAGAGRSGDFDRILPVYPLAGGLSQGVLRKAVQRALTDFGGRIEDELPPGLRRREGFLPKAKAVAALHFPADAAELALAKRGLVYEELFYLETMIGQRAAARRAIPRTGRRPAAAGAVPPSAGGPGLPERLIERLPFDLTPGQAAAYAELAADLDSAYPMARLLQGDVGCGKTLVAVLAALRVVAAGGQAAILAPTELLARQHAETVAALVEPLGVRPAFLTGNVKASGRTRLLAALASGEIDLAIGTHALFSKDVAYKDLRLVVVDEQHRFGVLQRAAILAKGDRPDLLMMSATPIPRSLALTVFGDLDVTVITDRPPGRRPVKTHLAKQSNAAKVYDFVRRELAAGRQAYFVYPLIETGEAASAADEAAGAPPGAAAKADLKAAETMARRLAQRIFPGFPLALAHSKLDDDAKRSAMADFRSGAARILVATSVVEVGVDVPNASCMVVEHAERFGLAALHQLRGRVGRGRDQAYCFLVYSDEPTEDGKARLKVMLEESDGFAIAEADLKLRGPGQIAGVEQSGYLALGLADPVRDHAELAKARADAFAMLAADPGLLEPEHRVVAAVLERAPPFSQVTA